MERKNLSLCPVPIKNVNSGLAIFLLKNASTNRTNLSLTLKTSFKYSQLDKTK